MHVAARLPNDAAKTELVRFHAYRVRLHSLPVLYCSISVHVPCDFCCFSGCSVSYLQQCQGRLEVMAYARLPISHVYANVAGAFKAHLWCVVIFRVSANFWFGLFFCSGMTKLIHTHTHTRLTALCPGLPR